MNLCFFFFFWCLCKALPVVKKQEGKEKKQQIQVEVSNWLCGKSASRCVKRASFRQVPYLQPANESTGGDSLGIVGRTTRTGAECKRGVDISRSQVADPGVATIYVG